MGYAIAVIDDETAFLDSTRRALLLEGHKDISLFSNPLEIARLLPDRFSFDLALIDLTMPGMSGEELLERIKEQHPETECIVVTAVNDAETAVRCLKKGGYDYLLKPVSRDDLVHTVRRALEKRDLLRLVSLGREQETDDFQPGAPFQPLLTTDPAMRKLLRAAELHARGTAPVLVTGESGTGKELLARGIHGASGRSSGPFLAVNMASLGGELFDAEFFGHTRGAFTGAQGERQGHIESAGGGTLFLDEIGSLPLAFQGKLLRFLQEAEFFKIGSSRPQKSTARVIAATNENLPSLIDQGLFRKDLFYRLQGAWLHLPPLRERACDIPLLLEAFIARFGGSGIDNPAKHAIERYDFPGNVRELMALVESAVHLAEGRCITLDHLPPGLVERAPMPTSSPPRSTACRREELRSLAEVEREHILRVYTATGKNKSQSARILDIGLNTLRRKLDSYGA